jgi:predicted house-cleaning noncanonical NTP pyrophosphatase (MazG superfamily)
MTTPEPGKLVRDRIPDIIRSGGGDPVVRPAETHELPDLLRAKLAEEVVEFLESGDVAELADILEVVLALADQVGLSPGDLEKIRAAKAEERGGFDRHLVWHGNRS